MSRETSTWRNRFFLIGQTDQRGHAWHYKQSDQGDEPNHYPGFIPVGDVARRLFPAEVLTVPTAVAVPTGPDETPDFTDDNGMPYRWQQMAHKAILPSTAEARAELVEAESGLIDPLGIHGMDYVSHQFRDWLLDHVANLLDSDLGISSAGLIRGGRIAWVEISMPETVTTPAGFPYRANLLALGSHDGSYATTYKKTATAVVCDNTFRRAADGESEDAGIVRYRHTKGSQDETRVADARAALGILFASADQTGAEIERLAGHKVSDAEWRKVLDKLSPLAPEDASKRSKTFAENKRGELVKLWTSDERVEPWKGTALGVHQAFSTWYHHLQKGGRDEDRRAERNATRAIFGHHAEVAGLVRATLAEVQR